MKVQAWIQLPEGIEARVDDKRRLHLVMEPKRVPDAQSLVCATMSSLLNILRRDAESAKTDE